MKFRFSVFLFPLFFLLANCSYSQIDIPYVFLHKNLPATTITKPISYLDYSPNHVDAKSIGRGKTNMMLGVRNNKFWENPAFLTYERLSFEVTNAQLVLPQSTLDAILFINKYNEDLMGGFYFDIKEGVNKMINGSTPEEKEEGIKQYNEAIDFLNNFNDEVAYSPENPNIHGISVHPKVQLQYNNWGFSVYKSLNMAFAISLGNITEVITKSKISSETDWEDIREIAQLLHHSIDSEGNLSANALPRLFAVTYDDWVTNLGYGRQINENLRLGANLKLINRSFSTDAIDSKNTKTALEHSADNLSNSYYFLTADFGGLYHFNKKRTTLGWTFKNIIPSSNVPSFAEINFTESKIEIPKDANGKPLVGRVENNEFIEDPTGDTLIYSYIVDKKLIVPYELRNPFLFNLGLHHTFYKRFEANFDFVDIFAQNESYYDSYFERLRIGGEFHFLKDILAIRAGMSEFKPTLGLGLNLNIKHIILDIDLAYAYNKITNTPAYFIQLNFGYDKLRKEKRK